MTAVLLLFNRPSFPELLQVRVHKNKLFGIVGAGLIVAQQIASKHVKKI